MSPTAYVLWCDGSRLASYKTLGQALLGAAWRGRKMQANVGVFKRTKTAGDKCIALVRGF